jgi:hypothetical protein
LDGGQGFYFIHEASFGQSGPLRRQSPSREQSIAWGRLSGATIVRCAKYDSHAAVFWSKLGAWFQVAGLAFREFRNSDQRRRICSGDPTLPSFPFLITKSGQWLSTTTTAPARLPADFSLVAE